MNPIPSFITGAVSLAVAMLANGADIGEQVERAANSVGPVYLEARGEITGQGRTILPVLYKTAENPVLTWRQRLQARICCEWIERGNDIEALRSHSWETDPDRELRGRVSRAGPGSDMLPLAFKRFKERRLWYYYIEVVWKHTGEYRRGNVEDRSVERFWPVYALNALHLEPEEYYRFVILRDALRGDPEVKTRESQNAYQILRRAQRVEAVTELLGAYPAYARTVALASGATGRDRDNIYVERMANLIAFARPQDADRIEKYMEEYPCLQQLKASIDALRRRPAEQDPSEPAFQPGHEAKGTELLK